MDKLSDLREIDCLLAKKVMGWTYVPEIPGEFGRDAYWEGAPDHWGDALGFSTSLDACWIAQAKCIEKVGADAYRDELILAIDADGGWAEEAMDDLIVAGPEIRCRAMLAVMESK